MEQQQKTINKYNEADSAGYKEKIKRKQWNRERITKEIDANVSTLRYDLDTNRTDTNNDTLYSLGLIDRYKFDQDSVRSMWVYYKPKNKNNGKCLKSNISYKHNSTIQLCISKYSLNKKISIINLIYMHNYIVNEKDIIYIKNYCKNYPDIVDNESMFNFINGFFNSYKDLVMKNENTSIIDIKNMFDLINPYLINHEDDNNTGDNENIYTKSHVLSDSVQTERIVENHLNSNPIQNPIAQSESAIDANSENLNKGYSVKFGDVVVELSKIDVKILVDICNMLSDNGSMSYEEINKNYPHDPNNPDEHVILKLEKTLSNFKDYGFLDFDVVNNVYKYSINNEGLSKTYYL